MDTIIVGLLSLSDQNTTDMERINITEIRAGSTLISGESGAGTSSGLAGATVGIPGTSYTVGSVQTSEMGQDDEASETKGMGMIIGAAVGGVVLITVVVVIVLVMKKRAKVAESMIHSSDMIMVHDSPKKGDKERDRKSVV